MVIARSRGFALSPALTLRGRTLADLGEGLSGVRSSERSLGVMSSARRWAPEICKSCTFPTKAWAQRESE